jgi:hypothetical protein
MRPWLKKQTKNTTRSQAWWFMTVIPSTGDQEDHGLRPARTKI